MGSKNKNIAHRSRIVDNFLAKFKKAVNTPTAPEKTLEDPPMASLMNPAAILAPPAALPHSQPVSYHTPLSASIIRPQNSDQSSNTSRRSSYAGSSTSNGDNNSAASDGCPSGAESSGADSGDSDMSGGGGGGRGNDVEAQKRRKRKPEDFIFGKIIGEGSFSTVYLAMEIRTRNEFAIKVCMKQHILRERKAREIARERDLLAILNSHPLSTAPFFVKMYSSFQDTARLYFELTYAKNGELFSHIQKVGSFDEACTRFYAGEILHALEHMHSLRIVHRDLKPENILLDANMHILITDFGCAKILPENEQYPNNREVSRRCSFVGTAQYISPELLNDGESSRACDLWAYGAIIYQMVAGLPPFRGVNDWAIFTQIKGLTYEFPVGFNPVAQDLVEKLLVLEPHSRLGACDGNRYTSIREHPFFEGVEFENLHKQQPPPIYPYLPGSTECEDYRSYYRVPANLEPGLSDIQVTRLLGLELGQSPPEPSERRLRSLLGLSSMTEREIERRLVEQRAADPRWHGLCEGNLILKRGHVNKRRGLFTRRRMLLLTLGPHLYYADSDTMTLKGEIPWSPELRVECKSFKIFFVHTPNRTYYLQDPEGYALEWTKAIEEVRLYMYGNRT